MYCELKNKEVQINQIGPTLRGGKGDFVKRFYDCSEMYIDICGVRAKAQCDKRNNEKCLLNNYK